MTTYDWRFRVGSKLPRSIRTHHDEPTRSWLTFSRRYVSVVTGGYGPSGTFNQGVPGSSPGRLTNDSGSFRRDADVDILLVPDFGSRFGTRGVERVNPAAPLPRDPPRVVAQGGCRVRVAELAADIRDRRPGGEEQARERVAEVVEPEPGELRALQRAARSGGGSGEPTRRARLRSPRRRRRATPCRSLGSGAFAVQGMHGSAP